LTDISYRATRGRPNRRNLEDPALAVESKNHIVNLKYILDFLEQHCTRNHGKTIGLFLTLRKQIVTWYIH
jgi:hypothetical protein